MNFFTPTTFTWKQLGLFKWGIFLIGIAAGAYWPNLFSPYALALLVVGLALTIPAGFAWLREH